jgi:hypothetical protein
MRGMGPWGLAHVHPADDPGKKVDLMPNQRFHATHLR